MKQKGITLLFALFTSTGMPQVTALGAQEGDEHWDGQFGITGITQGVGALATIGPFLYAGGSFTIAGRNSLLARWDGTNWDSLNFGDGGMQFSYVAVISWFEGRLVVGGRFERAGGANARNVAQWDGTNWSRLGADIDGPVGSLVERGKELIAGGRFFTAGGVPANNLARWNGTNWQGFGIITNYTPCADGCPEDGAVSRLATKGLELYVGGRFVYINGVFATNIARWDGTNWYSVGSGKNEDFQDLAVLGDDIYVAGGFRRINGLPVNYIARWDGTSWHDVGGGTDDNLSISVLAANGPDLYAAGPFRRIGGTNANRIARWDGSRWSPLGSGLGAVGAVALASNGSELYVGGDFNLVGNKPSTNIALWHIPHALEANRVGNTLRLSWPATGSNFVLETSPRLGSANWMSVWPAPVVIERNLVVTDKIFDSSRFYRLRRR